MSKIELDFTTPLLNSAGTLGFAPNPRGIVDISLLGAFVTNPISWTPRKPAHGERYLCFPGGFLTHTGLPNPGLRKILKREKKNWARSPIPIIVHLLVQDVDSLARMVEVLEGVDGVVGIEIGLPPDGSAELAYDMAYAAMGELPIIVKLPYENCLDLALAVTEAGVSAVSMGPPRGTMPSEDGEFVSGRMYGPAIFPLALSALHSLVQTGVPVIGAGGVCQAKDLDAMLSIGVMAVQIDTVLWRNPKCLEDFHKQVKHLGNCT